MALAMTFLRHPNWPPGYRDTAILALHGSWNRTRKSGHKVVSLHFSPDGKIEQRDFVTGFELEEDVIGRPVGIAEGPDGAVYISDDYAGAVYRVSRTGSSGPVAAR